MTNKKNILSLRYVLTLCKTSHRPGLLSCMIELLLFPLRITNALALLIHGFGHALALYMVTGQHAFLSARYCMEGLTPAELLNSLRPFKPFPQLSSKPPMIAPRLATSWRYRIVAVGGLSMNLMAAASLMIAFSPLMQGLPNLHDFSDLICRTTFFYFAVSTAMAMASWPDLYAAWHGQAPYLCCGPAFAVRYKLSESETKSHALISDRLHDMVELLAKEASTRGGQSGGFSIIAQKSGKNSIVFDKVVKGKRQDIVKVLCSRMQYLAKQSEIEGYQRPNGFEAVLLHLRYATGGATHWHNAQPHWYEYSDAMMHHGIEKDALSSKTVEVFNMIAHNGDMDAVYLTFKVNGQPTRHLFTQQEARGIFQTIMPRTTSQGNSDSRSVAEWVDFVYTQGLAYKALRYAYFTAVLDFNQDILNRRFNFDPLHQWADCIDSALMNAGPQTLHSIADLDDTLKQTVREALLAKLNMEETLAIQFVKAFEQAFYFQDLTWVMRQASKDFVGEFALMVCTTLEPRLGVFSLTQAFSLGINKTRGEIFGSAEPQGVTSALHQGDAKDEALQINLEDGQYATVDFMPRDDRDAICIYDRCTECEETSAPPLQAAGTRLKNAEPGLWFPVNSNPKIDRSTRTDLPGEEVRRDLKEIPYVLKRVLQSFAPLGENHETMAHFRELIFSNLQYPQKDARKFDLVLFGVDFNQDLIGEFALALQSLLPQIKIRAENSGNVLKEMKRTKREGIGGYGPKTIFLGVSNSAQTQSTLAAVRKAKELVGANRCFVLTQSFLNSMSQSLGQGYRPQDKLLPNTFVNLSHLSPDGTSGRRRSEAATIVPVATQAVLTEIILNLTEQALKIQNEWSGEYPVEVRHDMKLADVHAFKEFQSAIYDVEIPNRVGFNAAGQAIDSPDSAPMRKEAEARAENNIEFIRAYALFAGYIIIATLFGVPVFSVLTAPLADIPAVSWLAHSLDAALFLSALWLIHLCIRIRQGRPVLERIGARAELYIDRKYIARMIERYNATLFSNAPAFLTPYFYWADTVQDALHRFGIRAHRGVVTIHRTPDERIGIEEANNATEENMVFSQIGGIRFNGGQPQSRDKVRHHSKFMNRSAADERAHPYQTVLSDSLHELRQKYHRKLSPETLRLINRRLIDLSDGLVYEFVVGSRRKDLVDQAIWQIMHWLPASGLIYRIFLHYGIDLKRITGDADTANQAQIQSTKHPVSPMDASTETMEPCPSFDALESQELLITGDQSFAILVFFDDYLSIRLTEPQGKNQPHEIMLFSGQGADRWQLVSTHRQEKRYHGELKRIKGKECLVIAHDEHDFYMSFPLSTLNPDQIHFLKNRLNLRASYDLPMAA